MKCNCLEKFAGVYCEVYVGDNAVSIVLKMTLDQWKVSEFKTTLANILTRHCRLNPCLEEQDSDINTKSQKKALRFQPDDIIILPGFPKAWQGMELLNVRLVVKIPGDTNNTIIPHESLSQLLGQVAPEIQQEMGHSVAFIDQTEITPVPPDASGRNSDESKSTTSRKSLLIALGVVLGVVFLVAIIVIVWYRRKKRSEKSVFQQADYEDKGENIRLMDI